MDDERLSPDHREPPEPCEYREHHGPQDPRFTRRRFLQYAAAAGGTAAAAGSVLGAAGPASAAATAGASASAAPENLTHSIRDIKRVVILMQENRSFDHYFGTLSGVRGFDDKQILTYQDGSTIFQQPDTSRTDLGYLLPYHLTDQTDTDLDHGWDGDHQAWNGGLWNSWVPAKTEETMGYFTRDDVPLQYALADAFTICDGYHQAIMGPTSPNRMYFWTGTSSGWTDNPNDYEVDFGPDAGTPLVTTYPELLQSAGISWKVYTNNQAGDEGGSEAFLGDFGDNPLWFYQQYNSTNSRDGGTSQLAVNGGVTPWQSAAGAPAMSETHAAYVLSTFLDDVDNNALPQVSWIVAPAGYCEHPSYTPDYGAHYANTIVQALFAQPELWAETALFITYDEHDGFFDHQLPPFPETSVTDEYIGGWPIGLGPRVPMLIVSPWTRGGYVDSNVYSHTSMLAFLQTWTGVKPANVTEWRSSVTGDLTAAFDFQNPDFSIPRTIPSLAQTYASSQATGGSTATPPEGGQKMPVQEPGRRPHRPSSHQPVADVTVDRSTGIVTADLTNTGTVGVGFLVYPDAYQAPSATPLTVLQGKPGRYTWDTTATGGDYAFSVYGPDGFLTSFKGAVVPAGSNAAAVPVVTSAPQRGSFPQLRVSLGNEGGQTVIYTLTPNDYEGKKQTVTVHAGATRQVAWPADPDGYYDVVITANTSDGFTRRYAGRAA
jgi:phospholipase C